LVKTPRQVQSAEDVRENQASSALFKTAPVRRSHLENRPGDDLGSRLRDISSKKPASFE